MTEQIEIRRARPTERAVLLELWLKLIEYHRRLDPAYPVPSGLRLGLQSEVDRGLSGPGCAIWLAFSGADAVGFAFAEAEAASGRGDDEAAVGWIHELWVEPDLRRRGIAAALVECARAFLTERGGRIAVRVEAANPEALAFWRALGFRARAHVLELGLV